MNGSEAIASVRTAGAALRPGIVLGISLIAGVSIGKRYDAPIEGLAGGLVVAAIVNGLLNWNESRAAV